MKTGTLKKGEETLIERVSIAGNAWERMKGLLGRPSLGRDHALFLAPCRSIHTVGMRFPIDLIFVDREFHVRNVTRNVPPGRVIFGGWAAWAVFEIESGWFPAGNLKEGDRVTLVIAGACS